MIPQQSSEARWTEHIMSKRPCLSCPICGSEMPVEPRRHGRPWTERQDWLLLRMRTAGAPWKMIAIVFGGLSRNAVEGRLWLLRKHGR